MSRSNSRAAVAAIVAAVGYLSFAQLAAFVAPSAFPGSSGHHLRSRVSLAASQQEIDAAAKQADLLVWAASKAASEGSPQAGAMQARADQAVQTLQALKSGGSAPAPVAMPASSAPAPAAPVAAAPAMAGAASSGASQEDLKKAKAAADLQLWVADKAASMGSPMAGAMKAKADQLMQAYEALKQGGGAPAAMPAYSAAAPAAAAVAAPAMPATGGAGASEADLKKAKDAAELHVWAAKTLGAKGSPQASAMQAKAAQFVQAYEALKQQAGSAAPAAPASAAPASAAPAISAPAMAAPVSGTPSEEEVAKAKEAADLLAWAAKTLEDKGSPEAAPMRAKANAKVQAYESLKMAMR